VDPADAPAFEALARDYQPRSRSNEWLDGDPSPAGIARFLERALLRSAEDRGYWTGLWVPEGLAGAIGVERVSPGAGIAGLDYLLGPRFRRRGLATTALRALVRHLFETTSLHRLEIQADAANAPSLALAERLGFRREGVLRDRLRYADGRADQAVYGLLREDWVRAGGDSVRPRSPSHRSGSARP
jgi:RimJ/RimL family protein N-acetyltransferase